MKDSIERRCFATRIEVRAASGKTYLVGRAASYGTLSADLGGFRETIARGAFARAVREKDDAVFTLNHDSNGLPFGRVSSGTLQLSEDDNGLNCRCELPNTEAARSLAEAVKRQDIREMSFAFSVPPDGGDEWTEDYDENGLRFVKRTLRMVKPLFDVSAVLRPAYPSGTNVSADMLTAPNVSSLKVDPRVLAEARSRGGHARRIYVPHVDTVAELRARQEMIGRNIELSEKIIDKRIREAGRAGNHGRMPAGRITRRG